MRKTALRNDWCGAMSAVLSFKDVRKSFGKGDSKREVVRGVSLAVEAGQCFGFLGPNGAGKTTSLRMALGQTSPDSGSIQLLGHAIPAQARIAREKVGVVPQMDNLDPDFSVEENLIVYSRYFGMSDAKAKSQVPALLDFAGLVGREKAQIRELSGGMKRRLTIARALVNDPDFIVLDEPTTGLDPQARHLIWDRLKALRAKGKTLLLTTHFMDEAERLCDRLVVIDNGTLITEGSPRELIEKTIEPDVVEVFGDDLASLKDRISAYATRIEMSGETLFAYTNTPKPLTDVLSQFQGIRVLHRPANLEDVFIKLTGRELRD
jgi:lipooligosaccharide transport system ATP-binding protein